MDVVYHLRSYSLVHCLKLACTTLWFFNICWSQRIRSIGEKMPGKQKQDLNIPGVMRLNLDVDVASVKDGALQILQALRPDWKPADIVCDVFTDGVNNKMLGCHLRGDTDLSDSVVVRRYGEETSKYIDRDLEVLSLHVMNANQCGKPLYGIFNNGIAYGFMPGSCLTAESVRDPHIGKLVAEEMVRMGAIKPLQQNAGLSPHGFKKLNKLADKTSNAFTRMRSLVFSVPESLPDPERNTLLATKIPKLSALQSELNLLERHLNKLKSPSVFCHSDLLMKNIVYSQQEDRCYFIDFEFAGYNYQAFEIANHFCEWAGLREIEPERYPDRPTQLSWLTEFLKAYKAQQGEDNVIPTDREVELLYVQVNKFSLAVHLYWAIWALVQAKFTGIDFDFLKYAKCRLDWYFRTKYEFLDLPIPILM